MRTGKPEGRDRLRALDVSVLCNKCCYLLTNLT